MSAHRRNVKTQPTRLGPTTAFIYTAANGFRAQRLEQAVREATEAGYIGRIFSAPVTISI